MLTHTRAQRNSPATRTRQTYLRLEDSPKNLFEDRVWGQELLLDRHSLFDAVLVDRWDICDVRVMHV